MLPLRNVVLIATLLSGAACTHSPSSGSDDSDVRGQDPPAPDAQPGKVAQASAFNLAGWVGIKIGDYDRARDLFKEAARLDPGNGENWILIAQLEHQLGNNEAAIVALARYAGEWKLDPSQEGFVTQLVRVTDVGSHARIDLLQTLFDDDWHPGSDGANELAYQLALERLRRGEADAARLAIERIRAPGVLIRLRSDKRFDGLVDRQAARFDVEGAARQQVLDRRKLLPDAAVSQQAVDLARALLVVGDNDAVLELTERLLATPAAPVPAADVAQRAWLANNRATALHRLGRTGEALAQLEQAAGMRPNGEANVNQTLNLGDFYCAMGRGPDALATVSRVETGANGYGRTVKALVTHCAALLMGDSAGADEALAYLEDNRKAGPAPYLLALLRADRMDTAARTVIERLEADDTRGQMLYDLQDFLETEPTTANVQLDARWKALRDRDDVKRAVDRVGRIEHYPIYGN